jgi:serine/threonine protein kinase
MWSRPAGSPSSADLTPGTLFAGFRVEQVIGRGSQATVYEATQLSLDRRVALKVMHDRSLADRVRRLHWPHHRGAVALFAVGDSDHGPWLAMKLVPGARNLDSRRADLSEVQAALAQAHAEGVAHGAVTPRNVLVDRDGRAYLSDFGLAEREATAHEDRAALDRLVRERGPRRGSRRVLAVGGGATAAAIAVAAILAGAGSDEKSAAEAPPVPAGARSIGSDLGPGETESLDCNGEKPSGASLACTISQRDLRGRAVVVPADGTITSWAVRGARGPLALQVLRGRGDRLAQVDRSPTVPFASPEPRAVLANLPVARGDRVALEVSPTATVGFRRSGPRASVDRWSGALVVPSRAPDRPAGTGLDRELLLRVDIDTRTRRPTGAQLRGDRAMNAKPGRRVAARDVPIAGDEGRNVACVVVDGAVALDLLDEATRIGRAFVPAADADGRLVDLTTGPNSARLRWRNPDGRVVTRRFGVTPGALR